MEKIKTIKKQATKDFSSEIINNFWLKLHERQNFTKDNDIRTKITKMLDEAEESIVCIQTEKIEDNEIITSIFNASKRKNRIYIITNELDPALKNLAGSCLIRYGIRNIGSFILVNPDSTIAEGFLLNIPLVMESLNHSPVSTTLNKDQLSEIYRFFCYNFWNKTEYEIINDFNSPQKSENPPLDFLPPLNNFCDKDYLRGKIKNLNNLKDLSLPKIDSNSLLNINEIEKCRLLVSISKYDSAILENILNKESKIRAFDTINNCFFAISDDIGFFVPKGNLSEGDNLFGLELDENQQKYFSQLFKNQWNNADWELIREKNRGDLVGQTIKFENNLNKEIHIKEKSKKDCGTIKLDKFIDKETFEEQKSKMEDDGISCKIDFFWEVIPFFTPEGCKEDKIYKEWSEYDNLFLGKLRAIEDKIEMFEKRKKEQSQTILSSLKGFFAGKDQKIKEYKTAIIELKKVKLSDLDRAQRQNEIKELNKLVEFINDSHSEITKEVFVAKEKEKWEQEKKILHQKIYDLNQKKKTKTESLDKVKVELENVPEKDPEIYINRKKEGISKIEKEIQAVEKDISNNRELLEKSFNKFIPPKYDDNSGHASPMASLKKEEKSNSGNTTSVNPFKEELLEDLPEVGFLKNLRGSRYLEIEYWEEVQIAKEEAVRLKAQISVKKEG
ncbi:MAG: hypothetical protein RBT87_03825 [bacterium]|jgi:hypothetical protein|nr:hypothetical protein [bacterium]